MQAAKTSSDVLFDGPEWTFELLEKARDVIEEIALQDLGLNVYPNQIEIISSEQMLDAYSCAGLPLMYQHWSFGKHFVRDETLYRTGRQGLAYEIVINSNPCISYNMEENTMAMQTLVMAHAAFGHNHFFKNNYLFLQWTDAAGIHDYLAFAKNYIAACEERYGLDAVEEILDAAHRVLLEAERIVEIAQRPDLVANRLRLGVTELVACTWLHSYLRSIKAAYPALNVELTVDLSRNLDIEMQSNRLDLTIQTAPFASAASGVIELGKAPYIWVANPQIAQQLSGRKTVAELLPHSVLTHARHTQAYSELVDHAQAQSLPISRFIASNSLASCVQMAADGMGDYFGLGGINGVVFIGYSGSLRLIAKTQAGLKYCR